MSDQTTTTRKPPRKPFPVRFAETGIDAIKRVGKETGQSPSQVVRTAVAEYIARHDAQARRGRR